MTEQDATKKSAKSLDNTSEKLKSDQKQERLAEALRANLRRRKTQNRERG